MQFLIRRLEREYLPQAIAIEQQSSLAAQWNDADYALLLQQEGTVALAAINQDHPAILVGFAIFRQLADEAELLNLAVQERARRNGIGKALIEQGAQLLMQSQVKKIFLEVRASNQPALALYASMGFEKHSIRKGYYQNPSEDAYVLELSVPSQ
jgi:ribosomal-protein-alanine N-acetyltransferase